MHVRTRNGAPQTAAQCHIARVYNLMHCSVLRPRPSVSSLPKQIQQKHGICVQRPEANSATLKTQLGNFEDTKNVAFALLLSACIRQISVFSSHAHQEAGVQPHPFVGAYTDGILVGQHSDSSMLQACRLGLFHVLRIGSRSAAMGRLPFIIFAWLHLSDTSMLSVGSWRCLRHSLGVRLFQWQSVVHQSFASGARSRFARDVPAMR